MEIIISTTKPRIVIDQGGSVVIDPIGLQGPAGTTLASALTGTTLAANVTASSLISAAGGNFGTAAYTSAAAYATAAQGAKADTATQPADLAAYVPITRTVNGSALSANITISTITGNAGTATALATARTISITGDATYTSDAFNGAADVTGVITLASVATGAEVGSSTAIPVITFNDKGLVTNVNIAAVVAPADTLTGTALAVNVVETSITSLGTLTALQINSTSPWSWTTTESVSLTCGSYTIACGANFASTVTGDYSVSAANLSLTVASTAQLTNGSMIFNMGSGTINLYGVAYSTGFFIDDYLQTISIVATNGLQLNGSAIVPLGDVLASIKANGVLDGNGLYLGSPLYSPTLDGTIAIGTTGAINFNTASTGIYFNAASTGIQFYGSGTPVINISGSSDTFLLTNGDGGALTGITYEQTSGVRLIPVEDETTRFALSSPADISQGEHVIHVGQRFRAVVTIDQPDVAGATDDTGFFLNGPSNSGGFVVADIGNDGHIGNIAVFYPQEASAETRRIAFKEAIDANMSSDFTCSIVGDTLVIESTAETAACVCYDYGPPWDGSISIEAAGFVGDLKTFILVNALQIYNASGWLCVSDVTPLGDVLTSIKANGAIDGNGISLGSPLRVFTNDGVITLGPSGLVIDDPYQGIQFYGSLNPVTSISGTTDTFLLTDGNGGSLTGLSLSQLYSFSSADFAAKITDETGSGSLVFGTTPTFKTSVKINNPANTFAYTLTPAAIAANRILNLPLTTATDTLATLGLAQTFTATQTFAAINVTSITASSTINTTGNFSVNGYATIGRDSGYVVINSTGGTNEGVKIFTNSGAVVAVTIAPTTGNVTVGSLTASSLTTAGNISSSAGQVIVGGTSGNGRLLVKDNGTSATYIAELHQDDNNPYAMGIFNDTFSTTSAAFRYFADNDGTFYGGTYANTAYHLRTNGVNRISIAGGGAVTISGNVITGGVIELGHATDTTLARVSAGTISLEGVTMSTASNTLTLTNKTISGASNTLTNISLTTGVTGTLPATNGGTGLTALGTGVSALLADEMAEDVCTWRDDFIGGTNTAGSIGQMGWRLVTTGVINDSTVDCLYLQSEANHPGIYRLQTGVVSGLSKALILAGSSQAQILVQTGTKVRVLFRVNSVADVGFAILLSNDAGGVSTDANAATRYFGLRADTSGGDTLFYAVCKNAGSETKTSTGVAFATGWHMVTLGVTASGSSGTVTLDAASPVTLSTNFFGGGEMGFLLTEVVTRTTAAKTLDIDFTACVMPLTR